MEKRDSHRKPTLRRSLGWPLRAIACLLITAWLTTSAQAAWDLTSWRPWPFNKDDKPGIPNKVVAMWTDTVLTQGGQPPIRGFGGRVMFYEGKKESPIKVDGTLVVFTFDETGRDLNNTKPDRKYVFTAEQLPSHYSKSKIGHSYSVWIPWEVVGGPQKEITLIVRFEPKKGASVIGEQARIVLPGIAMQQIAGNGAAPQPGVNMQAIPAVGPGNPASWGTPAAVNNMPPTNAFGGMQTVSYEAAVPQAAGAIPPDSIQVRRISSTSISLPPSMAARTAYGPTTILPPTGNWPPTAAMGQMNPLGMNTAMPGSNGVSPVVSAIPPTAPANLPQSAVGSQPGLPQPPNTSRVLPDPDRVRMQPRLGELPSAPGPQPAASYSNGWPASSSAALPASN